MTDATTRKRLGQYFSGSKVADLLVKFCALTGEEHVIDPMAGVGDMLTAVIQSGVPANNVSGIEIDPSAGNECKKRLALSNIFLGDAFLSGSYSALKRTSWDLVITNPPYLRYQSMSKFEQEDIRLMSSTETRHHLSKLIEKIDHLDNDEKACFLRIVKNYSGLSDLAVPAWILCAALTRKDGRIAMVVPESWISRDYALSIRYMLLQFFDIEYIVEDLNSSWFPHALVKTNLLVAKRVQYRKNIDELGGSAYKHIRFGAGLIGENSLVEKLLVDDEEGYAALDTLQRLDDGISGDGYEVRNISLNSFRQETSSSQAYEALLKKLEPQMKFVTKLSVSAEIQSVIGGIDSKNLTDIEGWGFQVGQGLRTGANKFFYAELSKNENGIDYLITDKLFNRKVIPVASKYSLSALRYQKDINGDVVVSKSMLSHRLLYIDEYFFDVEGHLRNNADAPLFKHIVIAGNTPIESGGQTTFFPNLSAVKPNMKKSSPLGGCPRHWFMLPTLADRHLPQLCISRLNYKNTKCCLLTDKDIVVDANFSTLWTTMADQSRVYAMFALLNSTWVQSYLETIATIMGGGALKIEASHLRKLPLPAPTDELISALSFCGKNLAKEHFSKSEKILVQIDNLVLQSLLDKSDVYEKQNAIQGYLQSKINMRQRKK